MQIRININAFIASKDTNDTATLKESLAVFTKLNMRSRNHAPRYLPNWVSNLCPHENLHRNVMAALFIITKNLKKLKCYSIINGFFKTCSTSIQLLFNNKKNWAIKTKRHGGILNIAKRKKASLKRIYIMWF